jgi:urea transporter
MCQFQLNTCVTILVLIGLALCSFCISFIDIALRNLSYSAFFPKRWTGRLFLVTHCLPALYKGPIQQSDSLCRVKDPQVRAQTQERRVRFSLYSFNIRELDFSS